MVGNGLLQPVPGFALARTGGLGHCNGEVRQLAVDFLARQHVQSTDQYRGLDNRCLGTVEAVKRGVGSLMDQAAKEPWA